MITPEFLDLFPSDGSVDVIVKFKINNGSVTNRKMMPEDIMKLLSHDMRTFHQSMTFDGHLFSINKIEIDIKKNKLKIYAEPIQTDVT